MIGFKYTFAGHDGMAHCNPVAPAALEDLLRDLGLPRGGAALDVGCGKAELLIRLAEVCGVRGVGIEHSPLMAAEARARVHARTPGLVEIRQMDASAIHVAPGSLDLAACLGASHALGGTAAALRTMAGWVRPGGLVLLGDGFWAAPPPAEFLGATGITPDEMMDRAGIVAAADHAGLVPLRSLTTAPADWDHYETAHNQAIERYAREHPHDPDAPAMLARSRGWRALVQGCGRGVLGFAVDLFRRPETVTGPGLRPDRRAAP